MFLYMNKNVYGTFGLKASVYIVIMKVIWGYTMSLRCHPLSTYLIGERTGHSKCIPLRTEGV